MSAENPTPTETPTKLKRYAPSIRLDSVGLAYTDMIESPVGDWIRIGDYADDLTAATAQLEEARRDRERLDWLSAASMAGALIIATDVTQCYLSQASVPTYAPTLRQAIDAAMQQKEGKCHSKE